MWTKRKNAGSPDRSRKLSAVILGYLLLSALVSVFVFIFLYTMLHSIADTYYSRRGIILTEMQEITFQIWSRSLCAIAVIVIFIALFLLMLGQRLSYLLTIIRGIEKLRQDDSDFDIPLEGNDELTRLAGSINFLSAYYRELNHREQALREDRETWVRSLAHDIRTPLTSMLSYSEFMMGKETLSEDEIKTYIQLVHAKSEQIRQLSSHLVEKETRNLENIDDIHLLFEQLTEEWLTVLEERFTCITDLSGCRSIPGKLDVRALRRIMDNLASNIEKYADPSDPVYLTVKTTGYQIFLLQRNRIHRDTVPVSESSLIGLKNIRQIAAMYSGTVEAIENEGIFQINISLSSGTDL